jgi:hypothetical protein
LLFFPTWFDVDQKKLAIAPRAHYPWCSAAA